MDDGERRLTHRWAEVGDDGSLDDGVTAAGVSLELGSVALTMDDGVTGG
jgi:hypothetical protein